jgi:hypothetical protein
MIIGNPGRGCGGLELGIFCRDKMPCALSKYIKRGGVSHPYYLNHRGQSS